MNPASPVDPASSWTCSYHLVFVISSVAHLLTCLPRPPRGHRNSWCLQFSPKFYSPLFLRFFSPEPVFFWIYCPDRYCRLGQELFSGVVFDYFSLVFSTYLNNSESLWMIHNPLFKLKFFNITSDISNDSEYKSTINANEKKLRINSRN